MLKEKLQSKPIDAKMALLDDEFIAQEFEYLHNLIVKRLDIFLNGLEEEFCISLSDVNISTNRFTAFIKEYDLNADERLIILLALAAEISPELLDPFLSKNKLYDMGYTEFGGVDTRHKGFQPSVQTALFILCGTDTACILKKMSLFKTESTLIRENILNLGVKPESSLLQEKLSLSRDRLHKLLYDEGSHYNYSQEFPAKKLDSNFEWSDLVFSEYTSNHLQELDMWLCHEDELLETWGMKKSLKRGYKALFYGPAGTGKTLTATLLAKKMDKEVYRIDLSSLVSKYIGETEKNLEKVFLQAEKKGWILFFDEADSLFGKRTEVSSSNDRYANQGTSYLLQRIEECDNMIILASNFKDNFDQAFLRRFQSIIYFPLPQTKERESLWKKGFSSKADLSSVDIHAISKEYELSGATIMNVVRYASLMAIHRKSFEIKEEDIIQGIRRENYKEGKLV